MTVPNLKSDGRYSPHLRTAVVFTGSGTAGAYHAGVLWALRDAGVKVDLVSGCGMGVMSSMFAAVNGDGRLWEDKGFWRGKSATRLYRWCRTLRVATWALATAFALLVFPLVVLIIGALVYPVGFLLQVVGVEVGSTVISAYGQLVNYSFDSAVLLNFLPRIVVLVLITMLSVLGVGAMATKPYTFVRRRTRGSLWWRLLGVPLDVSQVADSFTQLLWRLIHGSVPAKPSLNKLGKAYSELLSANLGQLGFKELIVTAHDVDARRDMVFALLTEPHRTDFFQTNRGLDVWRRSLEMIDLNSVSQEHAIDALLGALSLPVVTEPHLIGFASDSQWRGEVHRLCNRPDALRRLLEEVANAGVRQVILVSATAEPSGPHALSAVRGDARGRAGEYLSAIESSALRDAVGETAAYFQALFQICPVHNPLGPLDFGGCYDERSDREQTLSELVEHGFEDAYRQFIDPVVGASGDQIGSNH